MLLRTINMALIVAMPSQLGTISTDQYVKLETLAWKSQCPHNSGQFQQAEIPKRTEGDMLTGRNALTTRDNFNFVMITEVLKKECPKSQCPHNSGQFQPLWVDLDRSTMDRRNALITRDNFNRKKI